MDPKTLTGLILCFCVIASLSISQIDSARLDSRQRFRRQSDESVNCPEGTKPCKDDLNMCVTYCDGNPECADGSDELDCATVAPATSADTNAFAQITQATGNEIERANVPEGTTEITEATLPQITILDRETVAAATAEPNADEATNAATTEASNADDAATTGAAAADDAATTGAAAADDAATTGAAAADDAAITAAAAGDDAATTGAAAADDAATTGAAAADDAATTGGAAADDAATTGGAAADDAATTGAAAADDAATTGAAADDDAATTGAAAADDATTAAADAATDGAAAESATTEAAATVEAVTGNTEAAEGSATTDAADAGASTGADDLTSAKPGNGHGSEDESSTASADGAVTSADGESHSVATVEAVTVDANATTNAVDGVTADAGSDATTAGLIDTATGSDGSLTTVIDAGHGDVNYEDEFYENDYLQSTTTIRNIVNNDEPIEDDAINKKYIIANTTLTKQVTSGGTTTTTTTARTVDDEIEYYDISGEDNVIAVSITTTRKTTTTRRITIRTTTKSDDVEYYDIEEDEMIKDNQIPIVSSLPDVTNNATHVPSGEEATTQAPVAPQPGSRVELRVVVSPEILQVQRGQTYELTCTVYGADATTTIYWIQEEPERRYALIDTADANDKQVTMSQVSLKARITLDDPSKIGKYTCMAQDGSGNSGAAILTMEEGRYDYVRPVYPPIVPGPSGSQGYLRIVAPDMAEGDYVEIQCEGAQSEDEGRIQWFFNNRLLNDEQPLYPRGKTLHIRPISRAYLGNYRCSIPGSSYADANSVLTFGGPVVPSPGGPGYTEFAVAVQIVQGQTGAGQAQENSQVIFRCQPSEQATSYRWTFTSSQGVVNRGSSDQLVVPRASALDSGVYTCDATNARGQSAQGAATLYVTPGSQQPITGRCSIDEATCRNGRCIPRAYLYDGKNDCGDNSDEAAPSAGVDGCQPNEIRCVNSDRGRKCVQKFWMCDGDRDCDDGSDEDQRYCELLPRQRHCKPSEFHCGGSNATTPNPVCIPRSFQCDGYSDCPDRSDEVGCVKPVVVAAPQRQIQINAGQTLTIQCTARGSPAPYINWRLNWGHVCGDGSDNGRCTMAQSVDPNDPSLVTGTLTVRNVNTPDGGAYSCEALNNQGFIFAIPDAIVDVIIEPGRRPVPEQPCNCNGHSSYCSPAGQCINCQHNTAGPNCEYCATGYQGDARRGTPYDCQPITPTAVSSRCNPSGTHMERGGRCICKYNVEGDRCDQCKRSHFYLNPTTPNGCLPCFCSGVSTDCTSSDWRRQAKSLPLNNWNAVPKTFSTDSYEARNSIQQRNGGNEIAVDQSSLGRPATEVLYWKAPKETLGNVVTLYDGTIDIHFTNDGNDNEAPSNDEFLWLRGNNIDIVHKLPQTQRFKSNSNSTYSAPVNERTFTRKDGTYIDRENILMALSDLDTLLVKVNPIGGRRNAVLRGVTLNVAARDGYADGAPTVESCRCPANYTGTSCEKCAEGYGRPHPLVGIYLGQCWSCRSLCNDRSDRCDRDSGKCIDCQANSEGDRCERCRAGFILDPRLNQCVQGDQSPSYPAQPHAPSTGTRGAYYLNQVPFDARDPAPMTVVLDGSLPEQRLPLQVINVQPHSVVWGRTDGSPLPVNVFQEGNDLVFRSPSSEQAGNYICTITQPGGFSEYVSIYAEYRPGQRQTGTGYGYPSFTPASPLTIAEGSNQLIQPQGFYQRVYWRRDVGQLLPSGVYQNGNALQISGARPDHSGTYYCDLYGTDGSYVSAPYEVRVRAADRPHAIGTGAPRITIEPKTINLKEGQRMIVQYTVSSHDPIEVFWNKRTDQGYQPIPSLFAVEPNRLVLSRATMDAAGTYQVVVRNPHGEDRQELRINVEPRGRGRNQQAGAPRIRFAKDQYEASSGATLDITPEISGASASKVTWTKDGSTYLPDGVSVRGNGLSVEGRSRDVEGRYTLEITNAYGTVSSPVFVRWNEAPGQFSGAVSRSRRVQWNVQRLDLNEGRRLDALCRSDADPLSLSLGVTRHNGRQREALPLGLSFSNGYLSLGAVTLEDDGLEFTCTSGNTSDTLTLHVSPSNQGQDGGRSYFVVRFTSNDERGHQVGRDISLQCSVQGSIERPYEYTITKDGRPLENNVEVHPDGLIIIRNAQPNDSGRYRCEVAFPRVPQVSAQETFYDLRVEGGYGAGSAGSHSQVNYGTDGGYSQGGAGSAGSQGYQYGNEYQTQYEYVEATIEPTEASLSAGDKANLTCRVKGAQKYTVTWTKYAIDTSLPNYARQQGNSVILTPTKDSTGEQMYLQCSAQVPGQQQPVLAYAPVTVRGNDELIKKKKKRRS